MYLLVPIKLVAMAAVAANLLLYPATGPIYQQTTDYTCETASIMNVFRFYGKLTNAQLNRNTEMRIANDIGTTNPDGADTTKELAFLRKNGFLATLKFYGQPNDLVTELLAHRPVMVEWHQYGGHWIILVGYTTTQFIFMDSAHARGLNYILETKFAANWYDDQFFNPGHKITGIYIQLIPLANAHAPAIY